LLICHEIAEAQRAVEKSKTELSKLEQAIDAAQAEHDVVDAQLKEETKLLSSFSRELDELEKAKKAKEAEIADFEVEEKRLQHDLEKLLTDNKKIDAGLTNLCNKYTWVEEESG